MNHFAIQQKWTHCKLTILWSKTLLTRSFVLCMHCFAERCNYQPVPQPSRMTGFLSQPNHLETPSCDIQIKTWDIVTPRRKGQRTLKSEVHKLRVPVVAQWLTNPTASTKTWVWSLALLSGLRIGHCHELWCRMQAAAAPIRPLAWEPPHAVGEALKRQKTKNK